MRKIIPCLWYDENAEDAVNFYASIFENLKVTNIARYGEAAAAASGRPKGSVMTITFELKGQEFMALNGGPAFKFTPAISLMVNCDTQEEVDRLWERLSEGGETEVCGWLKDKFGVSWQIVPAVLGEMMQDTDTQRTNSVMEALIQMKKLDIQALEEAYQRQPAGPAAE
jgi:predicted 3-demethylubiquinone-9 3-methyltransferase (glyoxalase superfamily)